MWQKPSSLRRPPGLLNSRARFIISAAERLRNTDAARLARVRTPGGSGAAFGVTPRTAHVDGNKLWLAIVRHHVLAHKTQKGSPP